jgi:hypothetical protein
VIAYSPLRVGRGSHSRFSSFSWVLPFSAPPPHRPRGYGGAPVSRECPPQLPGSCLTSYISSPPRGQITDHLNLGNRSYREAVRTSNIHVNMYDVEDRRGWLLDGASAVLNLSRTQLSHHNSPHGGNPNFNLRDFHHVTSDSEADAAVIALTDEYVS